MAFDYTDPLAQAMTSGGDARIVLDPLTRLNRYSSAPYPRDILALASSTANDLSVDAAAFLKARFGGDSDRLSDAKAYADVLDECRDTIRSAYALPGDTDIFFAPSGTDLEYVALFAVLAKAPKGIENLLLGSDEVGSGCIHSAAGRYFAQETALGAKVEPAQPIESMAGIELGDISVRDAHGTAFDSAAITAQIKPKVAAAIAAGRHPLVHIVHGSKTGLVLPHLGDIDALIAHFGDSVTFVVDACQARITTAAIHDYLARGIIVFLTGSKFMGGPPFSGFALLPSGITAAAASLPAGAPTIFRRAEVPHGWAGRDALEDNGNPGFALRLAASLFELQRFQMLDFAVVSRLVSAFTSATDALSSSLGVSKVAAAAPSEAGEAAGHPIEMQTLVTLDLSHDGQGTQVRNLDFDAATAIHKAMIAQGVRLGQPVKCVKLQDGRWGATLRIGVSMPQLVRLSKLGDAEVSKKLDAMMAAIAGALNAHL